MDANLQAKAYARAQKLLREQVLPDLGLEEAEVWWAVFLAGPSLGEEAVRETAQEALEGVRLLGFPEAFALVEQASRLPYAPGAAIRVVVLLKRGGGVVVDLGNDSQGVLAQRALGA